MGSVDLLTREGEIAIAKRIEEGIRDVQHAVAQFPGPVAYSLNEYNVAVEEQNLAAILLGFLDPAEYVAPATQVVPGEKLKNDENVLDENKEEEKKEAEEDKENKK